MKSIVYVQYTNPAGYPPLEHSSRILADAGWKVTFLGVGAFGANDLEFPPHPNIVVRLLRFQPSGWKQKLHYLWFVVWCVGMVAVRRPTAVYCSDLFSTPVGLAVWMLLRIPIVYHEHDTPGQPPSRFLALVGQARRRLARAAVVCVIPNEDRRRRFAADYHPRHSVCAWNCPRRDEVPPQCEMKPSAVRIFYVGVIGPTMLPVSVLSALALTPAAQLVIVGYPVIGCESYPEILSAKAAELGVGDRVAFLGPMSRINFYNVAMSCHVGIVTMPAETTNINIKCLLGASNKAFDYMACGLALLVTDYPEWTDFVRRAEIGRSCDPRDPTDLSSHFRWFAEHLTRTRAMGEAGRRRVLAEWNYETQFEPVKQLLEGL